MGKAKRKTLTMLVTVSVPVRVAPDDARSIVRLAIANGFAINKAHTEHAALKSVKPAGRILAAAQKAFEAWGGGPRAKAKPERLPLIEYIDRVQQ